MEAVAQRDCAFRQETVQLTARVEDLGQQLAVLRRKVVGRKSEKMPPMGREVDKMRPADPEVAEQRRRDNAAAKQNLEAEVVLVPAPDAARCCPACGQAATAPAPDDR